MLRKPTGWATSRAVLATLAVTAGLLAAGAGAGAAQASTMQANHPAAATRPAGQNLLRAGLAAESISPGSPFAQDVAFTGGSAPADYVAAAWLSAQSGTATGTLCVQDLGSPSTTNCSPYSVTATPTLVQVVYDLPQSASATGLQFQVNAVSGGAVMTNASLVPSELESGSFEGGSYTGWAKWVPSAGASVNMALYNTAAGAPAAAHDGTGYLAFNSNTAGGGVYQDAVLYGSTSHEVATAWLSAQSGTATGSLCLGGLAAKYTDNCRPYSVTAGTYTEVQVVYDVPDTIDGLRFQLYANPGGGTTDMDTASLVGSQLESGSFEGGASAGWAKWIPSAGATVNMALYSTAAGAPAAAQDGTGYLAFNTNTAGGGVDQDVPYSGGTSYLATAWLSAQSGTATGSLCLWGLGTADTDSCQPYSVTAGTYSQVQVVYNIPAQSGFPNEYDVSSLRFQLYASPGGGTTDMDTASLVPGAQISTG